MKKYLASGVFALIAVFAMAGASMAATFGYTDLVNHVDYSLTLTPTGANTYDATFDITGSPTPPANFFASAFTFKFSGSDTYNISNLTKGILTQPWLIADFDTNSSVQVLTGATYGNLLESNKVGFYNQFVSEPFSSQLGSVNEVSITSSTIAEFTFDVTGNGSEALADLIVFKALYLTNDGGTVTFQGWLSKELTNSVPEAGALLLFGTGLIGLVGFRRSRRMQ